MIIEFFKEGEFEAVPMTYQELLELPNLLTAKYRIKVGSYVITSIDLERDLSEHAKQIFDNFCLYDSIGFNPYTGVTLANEMQKTIDSNQSAEFKIGVLSTMIEHLKSMAQNTLHMVDVIVAASLAHFDLSYSNGVKIPITEMDLINAAVGVKESSLEASLFFCHFATKLAPFTSLSELHIRRHLLTGTEARLTNTRLSRTLTDTPLSKRKKRT